MSLLRELKLASDIFDLAYIILTVASCIVSIFMLSQLASILDWYHSKILYPQFHNELTLFCQSASPFDLDALENPLYHNPHDP